MGPESLTFCVQIREHEVETLGTTWGALQRFRPGCGPQDRVLAQDRCYSLSRTVIHTGTRVKDTTQFQLTGL